jgi:hypothetical protein
MRRASSVPTAEVMMDLQCIFRGSHPAQHILIEVAEAFDHKTMPQATVSRPETVRLASLNAAHAAVLFEILSLSSPINHSKSPRLSPSLPTSAALTCRCGNISCAGSNRSGTDRWHYEEQGFGRSPVLGVALEQYSTEMAAGLLTSDQNCLFSSDIECEI